MVTSDTKLCVVEFGMPICDNGIPEFWFPDAIRDSGAKVEHVALWRKLEKPNGHLGRYIAFISEEDANFMLLKYPEMKMSTHLWPPAPDDKIFEILINNNNNYL